MSSEKEYDLKKSEKEVGQLYPVLLDKKDRVIDGVHRLDDDKTWKTEKLEHIDTEEKFIVARLIANLHRRVVPASETQKWINDLAEIQLKQGIKPGQISGVISEKTGYATRTITTYLNSKYKREYPEIEKSEPDRVSPTLKAQKTLGKPLFEEVKKEIKKEAKEELRHDVGFRQEIAKEISVKPKVSEPIVGQVGQKVCPITLETETKPGEDLKIERYENCLCSQCGDFNRCGGRFK